MPLIAFAECPGFAASPPLTPDERVENKRLINAVSVVAMTPKLGSQQVGVLEESFKLRRPVVQMTVDVALQEDTDMLVRTISVSEGSSTSTGTDLQVPDEISASNEFWNLTRVAGSSGRPGSTSSTPHRSFKWLGAQLVSPLPERRHSQPEKQTSPLPTRWIKTPARQGVVPRSASRA